MPAHFAICCRLGCPHIELYGRARVWRKFFIIYILYFICLAPPAPFEGGAQILLDIPVYCLVRGRGYLPIFTSNRTTKKEFWKDNKQCFLISISTTKAFPPGLDFNSPYNEVHITSDSFLQNKLGSDCTRPYFFSSQTKRRLVSSTQRRIGETTTQLIPG